MVGNQQLQSKEDQLSDNSEVTSIKSETPARIEDIFEWIEGIPLSKTTKNLARDFSDAVLMAEILKFYYPNLVSPHNYVPANAIQNKRDNWITLNRKVLAKIDMRLSPTTIDQLVHSQPGTIDKLLEDFRNKQMSLKAKDEEIIEPEPELADLPDLPKLESTERILGEIIEPIVERRSIISKIFSPFTWFFGTIFHLIVTILCFWRWFSREPKLVPIEVDESQEQLRESYEQAVEDIRIKSDIIKTLCHKIAFLEGTMKLKEMKITTLSNQLENNHIDILTSAKSAKTSGIPLKNRPRRRTQI